DYMVAALGNAPATWYTRPSDVVASGSGDNADFFLPGSRPNGGCSYYGPVPDPNNPCVYSGTQPPPSPSPSPSAAPTPTPPGQ
ncbi:MAG: hypothetical protein JOY80_08585, partial [Candidatus Dormibacteraeota bacterium]|nr:hypothetical protein [Candidatus Dormibacteraeota bacterium]